MSTPQDTALVKLLLDRAGLPASDEELSKLTDAYIQQQAGIESLYAVAATRYESPCLHFTPTPTFADWASECLPSPLPYSGRRAAVMNVDHAYQQTTSWHTAVPSLVTDAVPV